MSITPGPWEAVEVNKGEALIVQPCDTSRQPICLVDRTKNAWDHAHLIAADPDLYYALKCIMSELPMKRDWLDPVTESLAKDALTRAEGNQ